MKKETQPMRSDWEPRPATPSPERQYGERNPQRMPMGQEDNPEEDQNS